MRSLGRNVRRIHALDADPLAREAILDRGDAILLEDANADRDHPLGDRDPGTDGKERTDLLDDLALEILELGHRPLDPDRHRTDVRKLRLQLGLTSLGFHAEGDGDPAMVIAVDPDLLEPWLAGGPCPDPFRGHLVDDVDRGVSVPVRGCADPLHRLAERHVLARGVGAWSKGKRRDRRVRVVRSGRGRRARWSAACDTGTRDRNGADHHRDQRAHGTSSGWGSCSDGAKRRLVPAGRLPPDRRSRRHVRTLLAGDVQERQEGLLQPLCEFRVAAPSASSSSHRSMIRGTSDHRVTVASGRG